MGATLTGYDLNDLPFALQVMEQQTQPGGFCQVQLCGEELPSPEVVEKFYQGVLNTGHTISYPVCSMSGEVAVTSFNIMRDMPYEQYQWAILVPLIGTLAIPALIAFGIVKIGDISAAIVPILLIAGGIIIITVALLRQPVTKYIESGRKIPYLPQTKPFKGGEDAEHYMKRLAGKQYENMNYLASTRLISDGELTLNTETMKWLPATKHDPLKYAESILNNNLFEADERDLYSGKTGTNPMGVPDSIWATAFELMGGRFAKLGQLYTVAGGLPTAEPGLAPATRPVYVTILSIGDTELVPGSVVDLVVVEKVNKKMASLNLKSARYQIVPEGAALPEDTGGSFVHEDLPATIHHVWEGDQVTFKQDNQELQGKVVGVNEWYAEYPISVESGGKVYQVKHSAIITSSGDLSKELPLKDALEKSISEEKQAQEAYQERAEIAAAAGDKKTEALFLEVKGDELQHMKEFEKRREGKKKDSPNFIGDTQEFMAETIIDSGFREKIDDAFQAAIKRLKK